MRKEKMDKWIKSDFSLQVIVTNMDDVVPMHCHDFVELVIFSKGNATHSIGHRHKKTSYSVMQGDCFVIMPNEEHTFEEGNQAVYYNIIFSPELLSAELKDLKEFETWNPLFGFKNLNERTKVHLGLNERVLVKEYLLRLKEELDNRPPGYKICAKSILLELILIILRCTPKKMVVTQNVKKTDSTILSIVDDMEKNPEKHYPLDDLSRKSNMCISGFTKKFRNLTGMSPNEYLLSLRMEKAEQLLLKSSLPVYEIAEQCGFYDINYFIKVFRRIRDTTPAKFRRMNR